MKIYVPFLFVFFLECKLLSIVLNVRLDVCVAAVAKLNISLGLPTQDDCRYVRLSFEIEKFVAETFPFILNLA